jgi:predicted HicB family RNase H-like nuclease
MSLMTLDGFHARIDYDEEADLFRGEILGLSGGADFYGSSPEELRQEFRASLDVFLEVCREKGSSRVGSTQVGSICASHPSCMSS